MTQIRSPDNYCTYRNGYYYTTCCRFTPNRRDTIELSIGIVTEINMSLVKERGYIDPIYDWFPSKIIELTDIARFRRDICDLYLEVVGQCSHFDMHISSNDEKRNDITVHILNTMSRIINWLVDILSSKLNIVDIVKPM